MYSQTRETDELHLPRWLDLLLTPRSSFGRVDDVRRARLFLLILLMGMVMSVIVILTGVLVQRLMPGFGAVLAGFATGYLIGRFISFTLCKFYVLSIMTVNYYLFLLFAPDFYDMPSAFLGAVTTILMAVLLLRLPIAIIVAVVNLMALLVLPFVDQRATDLSLYLILMAAISIITLLVMILGYLNESLTERAAEQTHALQRISDQLRSLLDASPDMMAVHANGKFVYINAPGMRMLGAAQADMIIGHEVRQFMPESSRSLIAAQSHALSSDNALTVSYQQTFQRTDRRLIETDVTVSPIQFDTELATLIVARDRRPTPETPSQNEFPLDRLLDRLPVPVLVTHNGTLLYANHYIEALTGYTPAELKRQTWTSVVSDVQTRPLDDSQAGRIQESEVRVKHKSGQVRTLILRTQMQEYRGQRLSVSIGYDPRQQTRWTDQDIWMLETAFANYPEGLVYLDTDVRNGPSILSVNRVFSHTSGYTAEELKGRTLHVLLGTQGEASAAELVRQALAQGEGFKGPIVYQRKDTTTARVQWTVRPIRDDRGHMLFAILHQRPQEASTEALSLLDTSKLTLLEVMTGYGCLLEMMPDNRLHLIWANAALRDLRGWTDETPASVTGWNDLVWPNDLPIVMPLTYDALRNQQPRSVQLRLQTHTAGEARWVEMSLYPIAPVNERLKLCCVARDIADRVQAEEAIKVHLVQQSVVMELGLLAIAAENFTNLVEQVVLLCEQVIQEGICVAAQYQPENKQFVVVGHGTSRLVPNVITFDIHTVMGYTAETSLPLLIDDYAGEKRFHEPAWLPPGRVHSALSVAIPGYRHVYGVLTLFHAAPYRFTEDDIYFIQSLANILAAFAERERMQMMEREQRDFMKVISDVTTLVNTRTELPEVLRITQEFIAQVVTTPHKSTITLINGDGTARIVSQRGFDDVAQKLFDHIYYVDQMPLLQWMIDTRKPRLVNDVSVDPDWRTAGYTPDIRAYLGAPIVVEDVCIGIINLSSANKNAFTPEDAERLMLFAAKVGTAIRNARHTQELESRITERTRELSHQRSQLQAILEASGEGVFYTEDARIVFANQALAHLTGYTVEEICSGGSVKFYSDELTDKEKQLLYNITEEVRAGRIWRHPMRLRRKDGTLFQAGLTISRVDTENNSDEVLRAVTIVRDTEPERLLEDRQNRFITNAAHELRSPITHLNTQLYLLRRSPQKLEDHLRVIDRVIERINRLVHDLLDLSYFEYGHVPIHRQPLVLQEALFKAIEFVQAEADEKQVRLRCDVPSLPLTLLADPHRLEQVFVNIISFALFYTDAGDVIGVTALTDDSPPFDAVQVIIEDNGRGLAAEYMQHVFEPFYRLDMKQPGSGLGLALAREIVLLHNGTLEMTSTLEKGTRFIIRLPLDGMGSEA